MEEWTRTTVRSYSGYKANERPLAFQRGTAEILVRKVVESWYEPDRLFYKVTADDGRTYLLEHHEQDDTWQFKQIENRRRHIVTTNCAGRDDPSYGTFIE